MHKNHSWNANPGANTGSRKSNDGFDVETESKASPNRAGCLAERETGVENAAPIVNFLFSDGYPS